MTAKDAVFKTYELLESIILDADHEGFASISRVNKTFYDLTTTSHAINEKLMSSRYFGRMVRAHQIKILSLQIQHQLGIAAANELFQHGGYDIGYHVFCNITKFGCFFVRKAAQHEWVHLQRTFGRKRRFASSRPILTLKGDVLSTQVPGLSQSDGNKTKLGWLEAFRGIPHYDVETQARLERVGFRLRKLLNMHRTKYVERRRREGKPGMRAGMDSCEVDYEGLESLWRE